MTEPPTSLPENCAVDDESRFVSRSSHHEQRSSHVAYARNFSQAVSQEALNHFLKNRGSERALHEYLCYFDRQRSQITNEHEIPKNPALCRCDASCDSCPRANAKMNRKANHITRNHKVHSHNSGKVQRPSDSRTKNSTHSITGENALRRSIARHLVSSRSRTNNPWTSNRGCKRPSRNDRRKTRTSNSKSRTPKVSFGTVEIREYEIELGDSPSCPSGPPISIGWNYVVVLRKSVLEYDEERSIRRRSHFKLYLPSDERERRLREYGFSKNDIDAAARQSKERMKRKSMGTGHTTVKHGSSNKSLDMCEESMESVRRKLLRFLKLRDNDDVMIEKLWTNAASSNLLSSSPPAA